MARAFSCHPGEDPLLSGIKMRDAWKAPSSTTLQPLSLHETQISELSTTPRLVIPAKAGIQLRCCAKHTQLLVFVCFARMFDWIPAFAGMTDSAAVMPSQNLFLTAVSKSWNPASLAFQRPDVAGFRLDRPFGR
jgi:hypothetical protein